MDGIQTKLQFKFDLEKLKLGQDFCEEVGIKKLITQIKVGRPNKQEFFRVRDGEDWSLPTAILDLRGDKNEIFIVEPSLRNALGDELNRVILYTCITRQGNLFLWPVKIPEDGGRRSSWNTSAFEAAQVAKSKWIRIKSNMSVGCYDVFEATGNIPEPEWPDLTFSRIIEIAFKDFLIDSIDHPVIQNLQGRL